MNIILKEFSEEKLRMLILKHLRSIVVPASVYRVQFNHNFTFKQATALIPYFKALGIESMYCSPYFQAAPGSMHGYDIADSNRINNEIGTEEEYLTFCSVLSEHGLGHIVDVVPNHTGVKGNHNPWWTDVLENGQSSRYAQFFDIDWKPIKQELWGKVLLPVLGNFYGRVLESGEIQISFKNGSFWVQYYENSYPIDPKTYPIILEDLEGDLVKEIGQTHLDYLEYLSICTAFKNLPSAINLQDNQILERNREKEVAKQRLGSLVEHSQIIKAFIDRRVIFMNGNSKDPKSFYALDKLLNIQSYRLAFWSVASQEINYRRFFDINDLAAIRIEDENVFHRYHELLFQLIKDGKIQGLRIDHPDGLYDPPVYFRRLAREYLVQMIIKEDAQGINMDALRKTLDNLLINEFASTPSFYVVAEKILRQAEPLPENWNVHGTVGYDFLNALNGLFVESDNEENLTKIYDGFIGHKINFSDLVYNKKKFIGLVPMASEINALGHRLDLISETNRNFRDFTRNDLTVAIREVIACFPVYRTYISPVSEDVSQQDEQYIRQAVALARKRTPALNPEVYQFLQDVLLVRLKVDEATEESKLYRDFLLRFQQLTGPIMAKGFEDTSFYVYNRLVSLNEVGGDPFYFGYSIEDFHQQNMTRNERWPSSMIASSTHDTKRSEDVRMRINVISELPEEWEVKIYEWMMCNQEFKTEIDGILEPRRNTEYFIYQTLLGIWPDEPMTPEALDIFVNRVKEYVLKSIREAKIYTNWTQPNLEYEKAVFQFSEKLLRQDQGQVFWSSFLSFQKKISNLGRLNSLCATLLKIASPGVVDIYQGNEMSHFSLVDPDNRQSVDFEPRQRLLDISQKLNGEQVEDLKFLFTYKGLNFRNRHKRIFVGGEYFPLEIKGQRHRNAIAFLRKQGEDIALMVSGRFFSQWPAQHSLEAMNAFWADTHIVWPKDFIFPKAWWDVVTGESKSFTLDSHSKTMKIAEILQAKCVCLLTNIQESK